MEMVVKKNFIIPPPPLSLHPHISLYTPSPFLLTSDSRRKNLPSNLPLIAQADKDLEEVFRI
jgi:hypothetical protein